MIAAGSQPSSAVLPELRQELALYQGPRGDREPSWLIYDPVRHKYFQISRAAFDLLHRWRAEPAHSLVARIHDETGMTVHIEDVLDLARFVIANNLALLPPDGDALALAAQQARTRHALIWRILHSYLFFKVPLVRPERFLTATLPFVAPLFSRRAGIAFAAISLTGLYFASRQWDIFISTFLEFLSLDGAFAYGCTLLAIKALHELGHAYAATRAGVRVNTMGIAFMVLTPILYTDVTDAWRLRNRRDKLQIDGAGIIVELGIAGIALFLWAFLADGFLRSAAFVTATTSLIVGLAINLNPLMRFDGYHLLADAWRVPNLQSRSNALAQWWLREFLFGIGHEPPEAFPSRQRAMLILYAVCAWVYRFNLFLGIALLVYFMFFKALGVLLFWVEIVAFILWPIAGEVRVWWQMREEIRKTRRTHLTGFIAVGAMALLIIPWSGTVAIQGVAMSEPETMIFAPRPARVARVEIADAAKVTAGQKLVVFTAPDLEFEVDQIKRRIELTRVLLDRIAGDSTDRSNRIVLEGELQRHRTNLAGLELERKRLIVLAPQYGVARDVDRDLRPGEWIDEATPIARIVGTSVTQVLGYMSEDDVWRVTSGAPVTFISEDPMTARRRGRVTEVVRTGTKAIELPYLASMYGGAIAADRNAEGEIKPRAGRHLVRVQLDGPAVERAIRGTLHLSGARESIVSAVWRRVLRVIVREASA